MEWMCTKCNEKLVEDSATMSYLGIERQAPVLKCPTCNAVYVEHTIAKGLAAAEGLLEKKRA